MLHFLFYISVQNTLPWTQLLRSAEGSVLFSQTHIWPEHPTHWHTDPFGHCSFSLPHLPNMSSPENTLHKNSLWPTDKRSCSSRIYKWMNKKEDIGTITRVLCDMFRSKVLGYEICKFCVNKIKEIYMCKQIIIEHDRFISPHSFAKLC